jgi:DNA topoisomerase-1
MSTRLVIVESPAKARTIARFLGDDYAVEASVGHIRDLPAKKSELSAAQQKSPGAKLGVDTENGFTPLYVIPRSKRAQVKRLRDKLKDASVVYLATDEDREGESISWHLLEVLKPKVPVHRLVFHEITASAIQRALDTPRAVNEDLVRAQEARRIIDRLFGYPVSELLWIKVRPNLSAGRVQSVAVRLVVQRERARMAHRSAEWWDVSGTFIADKSAFQATLTTMNGTRIATGKDFDSKGRLKNASKVCLLGDKEAKALVTALADGTAKVIEVDERPVKEQPAPPFTTSTLQQVANRRFKWTARRTMSTAQRLYENGWITYMRTDAKTLSNEAINAARTLISDKFGAPYLPEKPRIYRSTAKNAQEAHEAIRPAGSAFRTPEVAKQELDADERRLYELVWTRTIACQMTDFRGRMMTVRVGAGDAVFEAKGKTTEFDGFRRVFAKTQENGASESSEAHLPSVAAGDTLKVGEIDAREHVTKAPARLTEASLVKELEELGIGRPSTYATIIDTIQRRDYVFKKGNTLIPTWTAFAVTGLLESEQFQWLVDYEFTARMENELDSIALGNGNRDAYLTDFWSNLKRSVEEGRSSIDPRQVCTISIGTLDADQTKELKVESGTEVIVRIGKYGPFLQCGERTGNIPDDLPPDELSIERAIELLQGPRSLGKCPDTTLEVLIEHGRFGWYVQLGEVVEGDKPKPKRKSIPRGMDPSEVELEMALALLNLPREVGVHPDTKLPIMVDYGRYGPFIRTGEDTRSIRSKEPDKVFTLTLEEALELLARPKGRRRSEVLKGLGVDPKTEREVQLMEGRYGPYVTDGETNASVGKKADPDVLTLAQAIALIRAREEAGPSKRARRGRR